MKYLGLVAAALAAAPALGHAATLEERVAKIEQQAFLADAAFMLGGIDKCGVAVGGDQITAFFMRNGAENPGANPALIRNAFLGAMAAMTENGNPQSTYCRALNAKLSEWKLID